MVYYSYGLGYAQTKDARLREEYGPVIFNTARSLAQRFNPKVGCTESWGPVGPPSPPCADQHSAAQLTPATAAWLNRDARPR